MIYVANIFIVFDLVEIEKYKTPLFVWINNEYEIWDYTKKIVQLKSMSNNSLKMYKFYVKIILIFSGGGQ